RLHRRARRVVRCPRARRPHSCRLGLDLACGRPAQRLLPGMAHAGVTLLPGGERGPGLLGPLSPPRTGTISTTGSAPLVDQAEAAGRGLALHTTTGKMALGVTVPRHLYAAP